MGFRTTEKGESFTTGRSGGKIIICTYAISRGFCKYTAHAYCIQYVRGSEAILYTIIITKKIYVYLKR